MPRKTNFAQLWLDKKRFPRFASWVRQDGPTSARCTLCMRSFSVANMGVSALEAHMRTAKHQASVKDTSFPIESLWCKPASTTSAPTAATTSAPSAATTSAPCASPATTSDGSLIALTSPAASSFPPKKSQLTHDIHLSRAITDAEIIYCLRLISLHHSYNSCVSLNNTFKMMFSDSEIADGFSLGRDKASYIVCYGLAPYFKSQILQKMKTPSPQMFTTSFDEAFNQVVNKNQCDVHVTFFDNCKNQVVSHYLGSTFLGHSTATDIMRSLISVHRQLDVVENMTQLSMDGPNVNFLVHKEISWYKSENNPSSPALLELGTCGLHNVHGAYKAGQLAASWPVKRLLKSCYVVFHNSPARRADYLHANNIDDREETASDFPQSFCGHRWLENGGAIQRLVHIIDKIQNYVQYIQRQPVSKRPTSSSFNFLLENINTADSLNLRCAELEFSKYVCDIMEPFLTKFQAQRPLAVFLYDELHHLLRMLMTCFVKETILESAKSASQLCKIELDKGENLKSTENIDMGFSTKSRYAKISSPRDKLSFRLNIRAMLVAICQKLIERCPLKYKLTKAISAFSPFVIHKSATQALQRLDLLLGILHEKCHVSGTIADQAKRQFQLLVQDPDFLLKCKRFQFCHRLDDFYFSNVGTQKEYDELWTVIRLILILSHGNGHVESGFSINSDLLVPNLKQETIQSQRIVYDAVTKAGGALQIAINDDLRKSVSCARQR
jgi:hypothetical protein